MSNKLQKGDYVTDLTEEQFDELMNIEGAEPSVGYSYVDDLSILYFYDSPLLLMTIQSKFTDFRLKTQLTFDEFKQRAINTFGDE